MFKKTTLALGLLMLLPQAHAHRQWLLPSNTQIDAKEAWVTIDGAVSENLFDFDSNALALDNLEVVAPDGSQVKAETITKSKFRGSADFKLLQKGTYKISQNSQNVMATYRLNGEEKRWRGAEEKMAQEIPAERRAGIRTWRPRRPHSASEPVVSRRQVRRSPGQALPRGYPSDPFLRSSS